MARQSFSIQSNSSERELSFIDLTEDGFTVTYRSNEVQASCRIYELNHEEVTMFFQRLASHEHPWSISEKWESLEGAFSISAACSSLGTVFFTVKLSRLSGSPEEWQLAASLTSELGQLQNLAKNASRFFQVGA